MKQTLTFNICKYYLSYDINKLHVIKKQLVTGALNGKLHSVKRGKLSQANMGMLVKGNMFSRRKILLLLRNIVDLWLCTHFRAKILYSRFNHFPQLDYCSCILSENILRLLANIIITIEQIILRVRCKSIL